MGNLNDTGFGYVSMLWDGGGIVDSTVTNPKVGGYCVVGTLVGTANLGDVLVVDTTADDSYSTTTSANATSVAGVLVAGLNTAFGSGWDFDTTAVPAGTTILVQVEGVALVTAGAAIATRGTLVGTTTTAGRVATTSTTSANIGRTLQVASGAGSQIRILISR